MRMEKPIELTTANTRYTSSWNPIFHCSCQFMRGCKGSKASLVKKRFNCAILQNEFEEKAEQSINFYEKRSVFQITPKKLLWNK